MNHILCHGLGEGPAQWECVLRRLPFPADCPNLFAPARSVTARSLVICGSRDRANRKGGQLLSQAVKGSRFVEIEGAGHQVNVDAPIPLSRAIASFWTA